jgi:hypothetical protein
LPKLRPAGRRPEFATSVNIYVMSREVTEPLDHTALASKSPPIGDFALRSDETK